MTFECPNPRCDFEIDPMKDGEECPMCGHNPYRDDD
jgi:hypothetical protein